jgi:hypothetical protein
LYFMGMNLSNVQIGQELDLNKDDVQRMATQLRAGVVTHKPAPILQGTVECDEAYVIAVHKGHPSAVKKKRAVRDGAIASRVRRAAARLRRKSPRSLA